MSQQSNLAHKPRAYADLQLITLDETSLTWPRVAHLSEGCERFQERAKLLGFAIKFEVQLAAMERLIPNFPGFPFRVEAESVLHLMHGGLQSGLYVHLDRGPFPSLERLQATRAVYQHLNDILAYTTSDNPDLIQTVSFLDASSGMFHIVQYWIDYPGNKNYATRVVSETIHPVLEGLSSTRSIDLTSWSRPIARILRPLLSELAVLEWKE